VVVVAAAVAVTILVAVSSNK